MNETSTLPDDIEALKALIEAQRKELSTLKSERLTLRSALHQYQQEIEKLQAQLAKLRRMKFGQSSEKVRAQIGQLQIELEELYVGYGEDVSKLPESLQAELEELKDKQKRAKDKDKRQPRRKPLPSELPRETSELAPPSCCTECQVPGKPLGEDVSEVLEYLPAGFYVVRYVRPKLACPRCDQILQASAPSRPIPRSYAGPGLLARVVINKYLDHLPLHRQAAIFARDGVELPESTLGDWIGGVHHLVAPLMQGLRRALFQAHKIHGDDTTLSVLTPGAGKARTARLWVYARDDRGYDPQAAPAVWFQYSPDRQAIHPVEHLKGFEGILQADAYSGFHAVCRGGKVQVAGCWAHARRKFHDIHVTSPTEITAYYLKQVQHLYAVEKLVRGKPAKERLAARHQYALPVIKALKPWLVGKGSINPMLVSG